MVVAKLLRRQATQAWIEYLIFAAQAPRMPPRAQNRWKKGWPKGNFLPSEPYILTQVGTLATKISPVVHLNILKVTCFMMEVAKIH